MSICSGGRIYEYTEDFVWDFARRTCGASLYFAKSKRRTITHNMLALYHKLSKNAIGEINFFLFLLTSLLFYDIIINVFLA